MNMLTDAAVAPADGVSLGPAAIAHIKKQMAGDPAAIGFRLAVTRTGCSGLAYVVKLVQQAGEDDLAFPVGEGLTVYVDRDSYPALRGTHVDFVRDGLNLQFVFDNPNAKSACGCGESFSV